MDLRKVNLIGKNNPYKLSTFFLQENEFDFLLGLQLKNSVKNLSELESLVLLLKHNKKTDSYIKKAIKLTPLKDLYDEDYLIDQELANLNENIIKNEYELKELISSSSTIIDEELNIFEANDSINKIQNGIEKIKKEIYNFNDVNKFFNDVNKIKKLTKASIIIIKLNEINKIEDLNLKNKEDIKKILENEKYYRKLLNTENKEEIKTDISKYKRENKNKNKIRLVYKKPN